MLNARIKYKACPLCGAMEIQRLVVADCSGHPMYKPSIPAEMVWMKCTTCAHVFTEGYFTKEALDVVLADVQDIQNVGHDFVRQRFVSARMIEKVLPYVQDGAWLDVGFGNGSLLFTAEEFGFKPVGIDLRRSSVDAMNAMGIESYCKDISELEPADVFKVISMADVLEHMPFPLEGLRAAHRLLNAGGVLLLSMPNMDALEWKMMDGEKFGSCSYWRELEHYHNFTRRRLWDLLRENGFEPVRYDVSLRYGISMEVLAKKTG